MANSNTLSFSPADLKNLVAAMNNGKLLIVAGAGLSMASGLPGWRQLVLEIMPKWLEDHNRQKPAQQMRVLDDLPIAAEIWRKNALPAERADFFRTVFNPQDVAPSENHRLIASLPIAGIMTTNYDRLFELAWPQLTVKLHSDDDLGQIFTYQPFLLKLHGTCDKEESIIVTESQYAVLRQNRAYAMLYEANLLQYTLLFLGYGGQDPDIDYMHQEMNRIFNGRLPCRYLLLNNPASELKIRLEQAAPCIVAEYDGDRQGHGIVTGLLHYLAGQASAGASQQIRSRKEMANIQQYYKQLLAHSAFNSMRVLGQKKAVPIAGSLYIKLRMVAQAEVKSSRRENPPEIAEVMKKDMERPVALLPEKALLEYKRFLVLGPPGMGKTTMLRYLGYMLAGYALKVIEPKDPDALSPRDLVPIYFPLAEAMRFSGDLISRISAYLTESFPGFDWPELLNEISKQGHAVLLLDGLDEVASEQDRTQVRGLISGFLAIEKWNANRLVLTCREAAWRQEDTTFPLRTVLKIAELDDDAIGNYLLGWYQALELEKAVDKAIDLKGAVDKAIGLKDRVVSNPRFRELAVNPFLLSLLAYISAKKDLPNRRVELYQECSYSLLTERHKHEYHYKSTLEAEAMADLLADIAWRMLQEKKLRAEKSWLRPLVEGYLNKRYPHKSHEASLVLDDLCKGSGILQESIEEHVYEFKHNTFREYFAAITLQKLWEEQTSIDAQIKEITVPPDISTWVFNQAWIEVFRLAVGMMSEPMPMLVRLFDINPPLAALCYLDAKPEKVDYGILHKSWKQIPNEQRVKLVRTVQAIIAEPQSQIEFIEAIFRTAESDTEVLYHCDEILSHIGNKAAKKLSERMFDWWPHERQFSYHQKAFKQDDPCWTFADIPAGEFAMGSEEADDEQPIHQVKLSAFRLGQYPVTVEQFGRFDPQIIQERLNDEFGKNPHQPVVRVSWYDAYIFSKWAGCRLPTEAEWEYACSCGGKNKWSLGNTFDKKHYCFDKEATCPVDKGFKANKFGLFHMSGNVWEWCRDWYDSTYYQRCVKENIIENPSGPESGNSRVLRGGSWLNGNGNDLRSAFRGYSNPGDRDNLIGFRCLQDSR